jgi:hypothetical protein
MALWNHIRSKVPSIECWRAMKIAHLNGGQCNQALGNGIENELETGQNPAARLRESAARTAR